MTDASAQQVLFDDAGRAAPRLRAQYTSRAAFADMCANGKLKLRRRQRQILRALFAAPAGLTDFELAQSIQCYVSGIQAARGFLHDPHGLVISNGLRTNPSGRKAVVWTLAPTVRAEFNARGGVGDTP